MKILATTDLTDEQKQAIQQLLVKVHQLDESHRDPYLSNKFNNFLDMPCFFLTYEKDKLTGFTMIYADGTIDEPVEVYVNVLPEKRRQSIATNMLQHVQMTLDQFGYNQIEYVTEMSFLQKHPDFLTNLHLKVTHKEHQLRATKVLEVPTNPHLNVRELQQTDLKQVIQYQAQAFEVSIEESEKYISESYNDLQTLTYVLENHSGVIGYCAVDNGTEYYIFGLVIDDDYRNQGYGAFFVKQIMTILDRKQQKPFVLGVDDDNVAARHLYANTGFNEETEIDYLIESQ